MMEIPTHEILGRVFRAIITAEKDPEFAREVIEAPSAGMDESTSTRGLRSLIGQRQI